MAKKTRMSSIIDHSSMGVNFTAGIELELTNTCYKRLLKVFDKASRGIERFPHVQVRYLSGAKDKHVVYLMEFPHKYPSVDKDGKEKKNSIRYELRELDAKRFFLNVSGNPTSIVAGANDIPVLVIGDLYGQKNAATVTFKYMNRVMYAILDTLFEEFGFKWEGEDRKTLQSGDINIQSYQLAWYSADLGEQRDAIFRFLRNVYGAKDAVADSSENAARLLSLNARLWDNNDNNLTIEARSGNNREFSLTFYMKDQEPGYLGNKSRVEKLIRWDCTLNNRFLTNNSIRKISALEDVYEEVCLKGGYDIGFIKYLSSRVEKRIQLPYFLNLNMTGYASAMVAIEQKLSTSGNSKNMEMLRYWFEHGPAFDSVLGAVDNFNVSREHYNNFRIKALDTYGIDITIPRTTHDAILESRVLAHRTRDERSNDVIRHAKRSNRASSWEELVKRDSDVLDDIKEQMEKSSGVLKVRKFKPLKIKPENFWIYTGK